ncbi:MAG: RNA polymerase sigma-70 factor, partial [Microlunatus sp.]|nr:RNA polymerase sigma-70 factor [Microlunatus sp.]
DPSVVLRSDGGDRVRAARRPVVGRETVVKIARWAFRRFAGFRLAPAQINGGPGFIVYDDSGSAIAVVAALVSGRRIRELDLIANPDKLTSLVPDPGE